MENCSNGTSNCSHVGGGQGLDGPGFGVFSLLMALLSVALCALTILTIAALCMARTMSKHLRIFLINILVGVLVMGGAFLFLNALSFFLVFAETELPPIFLCQVLYYILAVGTYSRPLNLALYSVVVLVIVRFGKKDWKMLYSGFPIAILWLIVLAMNTFAIVPLVTVVQFFEGVACFPDSNAGNGIVQFVYALIRFTFGSLTPLAVSIVTPVYCLCYIRRHSISGDTGYKKAISRLSLFLVTGNAVNLASNLLLALTGFIFSNAAVSVYLLYGFGVLSLLPTPIFIIMFLKAVQGQIKAIITCHRSHFHQIQPIPEPIEKL